MRRVQEIMLKLLIKYTLIRHYVTASNAGGRRKKKEAQCNFGLFKILNKQQGFTLLEIMVALLIFAIVATMSLIGLKNVIETQQLIENHVAALHDMELSQLIIQRDFEQIIDRTITDQNDQKQQSLLGDKGYIEFTRTGYINPLAIADRSELQRVAYFVRNNRLIRQSWAELDRTPNTPSTQKVLLGNVSQIQFRYLDYKGAFHDQWVNPALAATGTPTGTQNGINVNPQQLPPSLPRAVEVILTFEKAGQLDRVFFIPGVGFNG